MITRLLPPLYRLSLAGLLAPAVWVLSACGSPPSVQQTTYPYGSQTADRNDYRRAVNERLYEARVTSARAVMRDGGQRCWPGAHTDSVCHSSGVACM